MKGISPLIATVLLIAFVVAVGGLVSVWLTTLTSSQTSSVEGGALDLSKCASTTLTIDEARYENDGSPPLVNVTYSSSGTESLKNITITVIGRGGSVTTPVFYNGSVESFRAGAVNSTSINASDASVPPERVQVSGVCQSRYTISAECEAGDPCMKGL